ncbi:MAG TPA: trigger factor [Solirubrobacteraceae bacterium]|nr:trigger factor [Solirubrobacteraceae bacterium]
MAADVTTSVTELPDSRVRVEAKVPASEVERRLQEAAKALGGQMRIPGFRRGKVPPPVVIRRVGRDAVLDQAVRGSLQRWYVDAIDAAGIETVGDPSIDLGELPSEGQPLTFSIEIGVRPIAQLGEYKGLEVGRREPVVGNDAVESEIEALRERFARLDTAERPADSGDFVVIDYLGAIDGEPFAGGEGRDEMTELAAGRLVPGFAEQLVGASAGEQRTVKVSFPDDYGAATGGQGSELAGKDAEFAVTVKEVKVKHLPEPDDDFAGESAGFDSFDELREDIRKRLEEAEREQIEGEFREAVVDAAAAEAKIEIPPDLVEARARELWEQTIHALSHQGISKDAYLRISGKSETEVIEQARPEAEGALRREAVISAVVDAEAIEPTEQDMLTALEASAQRESTTPAELLEQLRKSGRLPTLQRSLAASKAIDLLVEHATPITVEQAKARKKLWTPGAEPSGKSAGGKLWTPGS